MWETFENACFLHRATLIESGWYGSRPKLCKSLNTDMTFASSMETLRGVRGWMPLLFSHLPSTHKVP